MRNDQVVPREVIDVGPTGRVVHAVGQVAHQHRRDAIADQLPQSKRAPQHAHVGVHPRHDHPLDAPGLQNVPDFIPLVGDVVFLAINLDQGRLGFPGGARVASLGFEFLDPLGVFLGIIVFASIGLIDGIDRLFLGGNARTPVGNVGREVGGPGGLFGPDTGGMAGIGGHTVAGSMDDDRPLGPRPLGQFIDPRGEFLETPDGVLAVMQIPGVADDHGGLGRVPALLLVGPFQVA